jgi:tetratricopeptide (TPR) repeat protein
VALSQATLDELWDFSDPAGSETRIRAAIIAEPSPIARRELRTQLARTFGLQQRYSEAHAILDALDPDDPRVMVRVALERGRLHNSAGAADEAVRHFRRAVDRSVGDPEFVFLHVDALHMLAIADIERAEEWAADAFAVLDVVDDPRTRRWYVTLHHNLGWARYDAGDRPGAIEQFEAAVQAAERYGTDEQRRYTTEALAEVRPAR